MNGWGSTNVEGADLSILHRNKDATSYCQEKRKISYCQALRVCNVQHVRLDEPVVHSRYDATIAAMSSVNLRYAAAFTDERIADDALDTGDMQIAEVDAEVESRGAGACGRIAEADLVAPCRVLHARKTESRTVAP